MLANRTSFPPPETMGYDFTFDQVYARDVDAFTESYRSQILPLRIAAGHELAGAWKSDIGVLNQLVHLWRIPDAAGCDGDEGDRQLRSSRAWQAFEEGARTQRLGQSRVLLDTVIAPSELLGYGIYELRSYGTEPGTASRCAALLKGFLPVRTRFSPIGGVWTGRAPERDILMHLWPYRDLQQRTEVRLQRGAQWDDERATVDAYSTEIRTLLTHQASTILVPLPYSPMR